jgi:hypothetical protein
MKCQHQKDHNWIRIENPLWPYRVKCSICGKIGKLSMVGKKKFKIKVIENEK